MQLIVKGIDLLQAGLITTAVFSVTVGLFVFELRAPTTIIEKPEKGEVVQFSFATAPLDDEQLSDKNATTSTEDKQEEWSEEALNQKEGLNKEELSTSQLKCKSFFKLYILQ